MYIRVWKKHANMGIVTSKLDSRIVAFKNLFRSQEAIQTASTEKLKTVQNMGILLAGSMSLGDSIHRVCSVISRSLLVLPGWTLRLWPIKHKAAFYFTTWENASFSVPHYHSYHLQKPSYFFPTSQRELLAGCATERDFWLDNRSISHQTRRDLLGHWVCSSAIRSL